MPSHVHAIIASSNTGKSINSIISNGKRFIAYDLIKKLNEQKRDLILNELTASLNNTERKEGKLHTVFETSFHWKKCKTEKFIRQELDSKTKFYLNGAHGVYPVTNFMELRDIDFARLYIKPQCPYHAQDSAKGHSAYEAQKPIILLNFIQFVNFIKRVHLNNRNVLLLYGFAKDTLRENRIAEKEINKPNNHYYEKHHFIYFISHYICSNCSKQKSK